MYLTKSIAREIITEISPFINFDLNLMDHTGLILASTNPSRINTHHEGARILISEGLPSLIVESDEAYQGCRKGVNLPITFSTEIVGVIGITGDPDDTIQYGYIMQKMCEMLIYETFEISQRSNVDQARLLFVNDLIHGNLQAPSFRMKEKFAEMGLNGSGPFTVAVIRFIDSIDMEHHSELFNARENIIKMYMIDKLSKNRVLTVNNGTHYIAISNYLPAKYAEILEQISKSLYEKYSGALFATIGNEYFDYLDIPRSYQEANNISAYFKSEQPGIYQFNVLALDFIVDQIPMLHKKNLFNQVFKFCTYKETEEFRSFILSYFECNGSLNKLAEKHYIHKNTVQYKIHKIAKKTGRDMRDFHDLFFLYLATQYSDPIS